MTTTKEFKTAHNLSDSAFKRLRATVQERYPDRSLVKRLNGQDWQILEPELFLTVLNEKKGEQSSAIELRSTEVVETGIQLLTDQQTNVLDALVSEFVKPEPVAFTPIQMNGSQAEITEGVLELAKKAKELEQMNTQIEADLEARKKQNETIKKLIVNIGSKVDSEAEKNQDLQTEAQTVLTEEQQLKALLQKMMGNG